MPVSTPGIASVFQTGRRHKGRNSFFTHLFKWWKKSSLGMSANIQLGRVRWGIFPTQGSNPCLLHWQVDSSSPSYQGSPWNHVPFQVCKVCHNYNFHWCDSLSIFVSPNCLDEGQGQVLSYSWLLAQCLGCGRWTVTFVQRDGWMMTWVLLVDPMGSKDNSWLFELRWHPTPVLLPGKSHGQRSPAGHSLWCCKRVGHDRVIKHHHHIVLYDHAIGGL